MIFATITQKGLLLSADTYDIPAQYSNNIQLKFVQDENYEGWTPTVQAGVFDSSIIECADIYYCTPLIISDDIITLDNNIMAQDGYLVLSITLTKDSENIVLLPIAFKVHASVGKLDILPPSDDVWQQVVMAFMDQWIKDSNIEQDIKSLIDTAETQQKNVNELVSDINNKLENGDFTPTISVGETITGDPGTNANVEMTGTKESPVLSFTIPEGKVGAQGPQGIQG